MSRAAELSGIALTTSEPGPGQPSAGVYSCLYRNADTTLGLSVFVVLGGMRTAAALAQDASDQRETKVAGVGDVAYYSADLGLSVLYGTTEISAGPTSSLAVAEKIVEAVHAKL